MTTPSGEKTVKSKCCKAEMQVVGGDEGTNHYECLSCGKPCDFCEYTTINPKTHKQNEE